MNYCFISRKFAFRRLILAGVVCLGACAALGEYATEGDWGFLYWDSSLTAWIVKYNGSETNVTVPPSFSRTIQYVEKDSDGISRLHYKTLTYTVTQVGEAFSGNKTITSVSLPASVSTIGPSTFYNCTSLEHSPIHPGIQTIKSSTFYNCTRIPFGDLSLSGVKEIGQDAFRGCSELTAISLPSSLTTLGSGAFSGCANLKSVVVNGTGVEIQGGTFRDCVNLETVEIGDGITGLHYYAYVTGSVATPFDGCSSLQTLTVGTGVTAIDNYLCRGLPSLRSATFRGDIKTIGYSAFKDCTALESVLLGGKPISIGYQAFYNCKQLTGAIDLSECESVGGFAFCGCSNLETVEFGNALTLINDSAFDSCVGLAGTIDLSLCETIGASAFVNCRGLQFGDQSLQAAKSIGYRAFSGCQGLNSVSLPRSLASLGKESFANCENLVSANIDGDSLAVLPWTFKDCANLKTVVVGDGVSELKTESNYSLKYSPFSGCSSLESIEVGTGVTSIQQNIFKDKTNLRSVVFNGNISRIEYDAFHGCSNLETVEFGGAPLSIGSSAFSGCGKLTGTIDLSLCEEIGDYAFANCSNFQFGDLSLPAIKSIYRSAFSECQGLTSVSLSPNLVSLGEDSFAHCENLVSANINGNSLAVLPVTFRNCVNLKSVVVGDGVSELKTTSYYSPFTGCSSLESVVVGTGVTSIQKNIFKDKTNLRSAVFNGNIRRIEYDAFHGCSNLETVEFGGAPISIGSSAFSGCGKLTGTIDLSLCEEINDSAFASCSSLQFGDLSLPNVKSIGNYAFSGCQGLTAIALHSTLTTLGTSSFSGCSQLANIQLPATLTTIPSSCFYSCTALEEISVPKLVTKIDSSAFRYDSALTNVWFKGAPPTVGSYAFSGVASGARGYYPRSLASKWLPPSGPIDSNGRWNGLIMHELSQPVLRVKSANPAEGSITLAWDDGTEGQCVSSYSIYRSANDTFTEADRVATGITDTEWTDTGYWNAEPVLSPLNYWVVAESDYFDLPESNAVETRHRYGLSVGIGQYGDSDLVNNVGFAMDANLCRNLALSQGGFSRFREFLDSDATSTPVTNEMATLAQLAIPGDMVMLFISAHGAEGMISLFGNTKYTTSQIQTDVGAFNSGVTVVGIIMACHSGSLLQLGSWPSNAALISSCAAKQISIIFGGGDVIPSPFGGILLQDGWADGYADRSLFGTSWDGGNGDGVVSFDELARYVTEFSKGYSDMVASSSVQVTNRRLLKHAIAGRAGNGASFVRPLPPTSCEATHGFSDAEIQVTWAQVADPTIRRYWLFRKKLGDARAACISRYAGSGSFSDAKSIEQTTLPKELNIPSSRLAPENFVEYQYHVCSVNPCGISDPSPIATGMSGTVNLQQWYSSLGYTTSAEIASARTSMASNGNNTIEECYVTGISPNDETAKFEARIEIGADGKPIVSWEPDLNEGGTKSERVYRVLGAKSLGASAEWDDITDIAAPDAEGYRFFKVSVELP